MGGLEDLLKSYDSNEVQKAMQKAKMLSQNPQVQQAFSRVDQKEVIAMIKNLNEMDKKKLLNSFLKSENQEFLNLIKKLR